MRSYLDNLDSPYSKSGGRWPVFNGNPASVFEEAVVNTKDDVVPVPSWVKFKSIGSPYEFNQLKIFTTCGDCAIEANPKSTIPPFSDTSCLIGQGKILGCDNVPEHWMTYNVNLMGKKIASFNGTIAYRNKCYASVSFVNSFLPNINSLVSADPGLTLFEVSTGAKSESSGLKWTAPSAVPTLKFSYPNISLDVPCQAPSASGCRDKTFLNYMIQWPNLVGSLFLKAWYEASSGEDIQKKNSIVALSQCVYVKTELFSDSIVVDGFDVSYNAFSWTLGKVVGGWIDCPRDTNAARQMYPSSQFLEVDCSNPEATVALYRKPCAHPPCPSQYTHASRIWYPGKVGWTSKFGSGPLMTHGRLLEGGMDAVINPYNMDYPNSNCGIHYGIPSLCFKQLLMDESSAHTKELDVFGLSEKEVSLLSSFVKNVQPYLKTGFDVLYEKWLDFSALPENQLTSCLSSLTKNSYFDELILMGKAIEPLIIEKLSSREQFKAVVLYENIAGLQREYTLMSIQDLASHYVHEWLDMHDVDFGLGI